MKFQRSNDNKIIAGVCGGLSEAFGIDPIAIRLSFLLAFLMFGVGPITYLILWILMTNSDAADS